MEKTIIEIENTLSKINSRLEDAEEWISNLKDKLMESNQAEQVGGLRKMRVDLGNSGTPIT